MTEDRGAWATALDLPAEQAEEFARLAGVMGSSPPEILRLMVGRVTEMDRDLRALGLRGVAAWVSGRKAADAAADHGAEGLPLDIRPSGMMWPADKPFPWSAEECRAAVICYEVKWRGGHDDFLHLLRGSWEKSDGYAYLRQR